MVSVQKVDMKYKVAEEGDVESICCMVRSVVVRIHCLGAIKATTER